MISLREEVSIPASPDRVWPLLSDPAVVASCIPGAELTKSGKGGGAYQGTMRVKFGPTVATFRGEAKLAYDHDARRCTIEGRGIDGRGASRANASGVVTASGSDATVLTVEGQFHVTGPLETFANAGGVHLARALLAEFGENMAKLVGTEQTENPSPPFRGEREAREGEVGLAERSGIPHLIPTLSAPEGGEGAHSGKSAPAVSGSAILWRAVLSWLRQLFSAKKDTR